MSTFSFQPQLVYKHRKHSEMTPNPSAQTGSAGESSQDIKTLAFFDLETTGIPDLEFFKTKITELTIVAVSVEHFLESDIPRVQHKLSLCFNPMKRIDIKAMEVTGLSNELLERERKFDQNAMKLIECFVFQLQQPVCLIAHNGNKFDFPLIKKQCESLEALFPFSMQCCDSIPIFKEIDALDEQKIEALKNSYSLKRWDDIKNDDFILSAEVERLLDEDVTRPEPEDDGSDQILHELVKKELDNISNREKIEKTMREINETTPEQVTKLVNLQPHAQTSNVTRNPSAAAKRSLFQSPSAKPAPKFNQKSFALRELHKRFFGKYPETSHAAESDVITLLHCAFACKTDFVRLVKEKCVSFDKAPKF